MEIWKDIEGYEGYYQISNIGRIKSLSRIRKNWTGGTWFTEEFIFKKKLNKDGYSVVNLTKNNKVKGFKVHRLVACAFLERPEGKNEVNHKNGVRDDNRVENLEWVTHEENNAYKQILDTQTKKYIKCIETGQIFRTSKEASKTNGGDPGNIRRSARDKNRSCYGFRYIYVNKEP